MSEDILHQKLVFEQLEQVYKEIDEQQSKFDCGINKTYGGAATLQAARTRRKALLSDIKPVRLVWSHPFPDTLPAPCKRTRNEIRAFIGLEPVEEE